MSHEINVSFGNDVIDDSLISNEPFQPRGMMILDYSESEDDVIVAFDEEATRYLNLGQEDEDPQEAVGYNCKYRFIAKPVNSVSALEKGGYPVHKKDIKKIMELEHARKSSPSQNIAAQSEASTSKDLRVIRVNPLGNKKWPGSLFETLRILIDDPNLVAGTWEEELQQPLAEEEEPVAAGPSQRHSLSKAFECAMCGEKFENKGKLKCHLGIHVFEFEDGKCPRCDFTYSTKPELGVHFKECHVDQEIQCEVCTKIFANFQKYEDHAIIRSCFQCERCFGAFENVEALKEHERVHKIQLYTLVQVEDELDE